MPFSSALLPLMAWPKQTFSVHLVHKHFDIPECRIMLYETVKGTTTHQDFVLSSPRALCFKAAPGGNMVAYKFTTDPGADLSAHEDFVAAFANAAVDMGVQDVFALTAVSICPENTILTAFELAQALSTILVSDASWLPAGDVAGSTTTDWIADQEASTYRIFENHVGSPPAGPKVASSRSITLRFHPQIQRVYVNYYRPPEMPPCNARQGLTLRLQEGQLAESDRTRSLHHSINSPRQ